MHEMGLMLMLVLQTMETRLRCIDETARQMMVFGAIVELHVPTHRDEEHHEGHHEGTYLQQLLFHAAKIEKKRRMNGAMVHKKAFVTPKSTLNN